MCFPSFRNKDDKVHLMINICKWLISFHVWFINEWRVNPRAASFLHAGGRTWCKQSKSSFFWPFCSSHWSALFLKKLFWLLIKPNNQMINISSSRGSNLPPPLPQSSLSSLNRSLRSSLSSSGCKPPSLLPLWVTPSPPLSVRLHLQSAARDAEAGTGRDRRERGRMCGLIDWLMNRRTRLGWSSGTLNIDEWISSGLMWRSQLSTTHSFTVWTAHQVTVLSS